MALHFCTLGSGSKGNSYLVKSEKNTLLVDAGLSARATVKHLTELGVSPCTLDGILITHEHSDHIGGVNVLSKNYSVPVYANEKTMTQVLRKCSNIEGKNVRIFNTGEDFFIGEMNICPFKTPHDSIDSCGFSIYCKHNKITVATDLGHMTKTVSEACKGSDLLVLESNHDINMLINGPYSPYLKQRVQGPKGHLSNDGCATTAAFLLDYGLKQLILAHLSEENNTPELAYTTVANALLQKGAEDGKDVNIEVAQQNSRGKIYILN